MSNLEISRAPRLDQYVTDKIGPLISRAFAARLISDGRVTLNGVIATKAGTKVRPDDKVVIDYDVSEQAAIPSIDLPVLYEDDDCVVIIKPTGLLVHSKGGYNPEATVASWLRSRLAANSGLEPTNNRAGIVHRLDRATSGVMICAKNSAALSWLQKQFSQRRVKKTYLAVISGRPAEDEAIIDMPIERNPKAPATFRVGANGKPSVTQYRVLESSPQYSLLELKPTTGRTHQLRVHLKQIGHPIVGDIMYGGQPADRLYLHAAELEITLPNHERRVFEAALPPEFRAIIATL